MKKILFLILLCFYSSTSWADITTGLVGWWKMDEGSGTTALDASGNGNSGTLTNSPAYVTGKIGPYALSFNGTNSYVAISGSLGLSGATTNITAACWFYRSTLGNNGAFYKLGNNTDYTGGDGFGIGVGGTSSGPDFSYSGDTILALYEGQRWINTGVTVGTGWNHIVLVINASGYPTVYLNGANIYSDTSGIMNAIGSKGAIVNNIGGYESSASTDRYFNGYVDDMRVYSRALSAADVAQLYSYTGKSEGFFALKDY